jgi:2-iminobutanoate/2-iminopropanoate deaminase
MEEIMIQIVSSDKAPTPSGHYSQAVSANGLVFVAGQIASDAKSGQFLGGSIESQTRLVFQNLSNILAASNSSLGKVLKTTVFLKDMKDFEEMNAIYAEYFQEHKPARATIQVAGLPRDAKVEIELIALA